MEFLKLLRPEDVQQLVANWMAQKPRKGSAEEQDFHPVLKLFNPIGSATWLLTELDPDSSLAFGLCDLGMGMPELGYVCLEEVFSAKLPGGVTIEQDLFFDADKTISQYAAEAKVLGHIRA